MTFKAKFALITAIFLWASAFVGIRAGLHGYSPAGLALLRYLIASACMALIYYRLPKRNKIGSSDAVLLLSLGAVGIGIYNLALNYGELAISSGMASFIISQSPVITAILALFFLGERLTILRVIGFLVSVTGVALIALGERGGFQWDPSISYILVATLTSGFYSVLQKPFLKKYHAIEVTTYIIWGGTLFLAFYFPELNRDLASASLQSTLTIVYLGIFPATLGYLAWAYVLAEVPASRAGSFLYFMPFLATLLGWFCLGEVPVLISIIGGLLAIFGVWLVNHSYRTLAQ